MLSSNNREKDPLVRELREAENRRKRLEERRTRVLNTKQRLIGVDVDALDQQVKEKREREQKEKEEQLRFETQQQEWARLLAENEHQNNLNRKKQHAEHLKTNEALREFKERQTAEQNQAFEKKVQEAKAQTHFLEFPGEDLDKDKREALQKEQQQLWIAQQLLEQQNIKRENERKDRELLEYQQNANKEADSLEYVQLQKKKEVALQTAQFNQLQNDLLKRQRELERQRAEAQAQQEIQKHLTSALMTEDISSTIHPNDPSRRIPYHFKGFTTEERQAIIDEQARQMEDHKARRQKQKDEEAAWAAEEERIRREIVKLEQQRMANQQAVESEVRLSQLAHKQEHNQRQRYLNKELYSNPVDDSYFAQFGTSAR